MTVRALLEAIESGPVAAAVNVASTFELALEISRLLPAARELTVRLRDTGVSDVVLRRVLELTSRTTDLRYEHPDDVALMILLSLLRDHDHDLAVVGSAAAMHVPNLWWAARVATDVLQGRTPNAASAGGPAPRPPNVDAADHTLVADPRSWTLLPLLRKPGRMIRNESATDVLGLMNMPGSDRALLSVANHGATERTERAA